MTNDGPFLRDIHLPAAPSWWPPAPGWWLLAALLAVFTIVVVRRLTAARRARRWRQRIVAELDPIASRHAAAPDEARLAGELSVLLRRATRALDPASATLRGEDWLRFLDARLGGDAFERGTGRALLDAPWRRAAQFDATALIALARRWLEHAFAEERPHA